MNKKRLDNFPAPDFSFRTPSKSFFPEGWVSLEDYLLHFFLFSVVSRVCMNFLLFRGNPFHHNPGPKVR